MSHTRPRAPLDVLPQRPLVHSQSNTENVLIEGSLETSYFLEQVRGFQHNDCEIGTGDLFRSKHSEEQSISSVQKIHTSNFRTSSAKSVLSHTYKTPSIANRHLHSSLRLFKIPIPILTNLSDPSLITTKNPNIIPPSHRIPRSKCRFTRKDCRQFCMSSNPVVSPSLYPQSDKPRMTRIPQPPQSLVDCVNAASWL